MGTGKSKEETVKEKAREWQRQIRGESRRIERDVTRMRQEEEKLKKEISGLQKALLSFKTMLSGYVLRLNEAIHVVHRPIRRSRPWQRRARLPAHGPRAWLLSHRNAKTTGHFKSYRPLLLPSAIK